MAKLFLYVCALQAALTVPCFGEDRYTFHGAYAFELPPTQANGYIESVSMTAFLADRITGKLYNCSAGWTHKDVEWTTSGAQCVMRNYNMTISPGNYSFIAPTIKGRFEYEPPQTYWAVDQDRKVIACLLSHWTSQTSEHWLCADALFSPHE
jgi:hypothetical protein